MILYSYFRSSAAYRVRIGLNLKGLDYAIEPVHLLKDGGQQHQPDYAQLNPADLGPTLSLIHTGRCRRLLTSGTSRRFWSIWKNAIRRRPCCRRTPCSAPGPGPWPWRWPATSIP